MTQTTNLATPLLPSAAGTNDLRALKPPVEIPSGYAWLWWTLAALALAVAAWLLWRWLAKRRVRPGPLPVPAHLRAKQRLDQALALLTEPKPFVIAVSDALRGYLEERFEFRAPERTTEEFLIELQSTRLLDASQKQSLGDFLQRCDLVKFARYEPTEPELRDLHAAAYRLVEDTEPRPGPAPGAQQAADAPEPPSSETGTSP